MKICFPVSTGSIFRMKGLTCSPLPGKMIQLTNLFLSGLKPPIGQLHEVKWGETWCKQTSSRHYFLFPCHLREQNMTKLKTTMPPKGCPGIHQEQLEFMMNFHNAPIIFIIPNNHRERGAYCGAFASNGVASGPLQKTWNV